MIKCKKYKILFPLSFYKELSSNDSVNLYDHLKICESCSAEYKTTIAELKKIHKDEKIKLSKAEFNNLEEKIQNKISSVARQKSVLSASGLSLSYSLLMIILLLTAVITLKNPASYNMSESSFYRSMTNNVQLQDLGQDAENVLQARENNFEIGGYNRDSEIITIISSLVNTAYLDKYFEVRKAAVIALAQIGSRQSLKCLLEISRNHPDPAVRIEAIRCLAWISKNNYYNGSFFDI